MQYEDRRLCLTGVPIDMDKKQLISFLSLEDFQGVSVYMPKNTHNQKLQTKLTFLDFEQPWVAKVARRFINMLNVIVKAVLAVKEPKQSYECFLPRLVDGRTNFSNGTVPEKGICEFCLFSGATLLCDVCYTSYSASFYCNEEHQAKDWNRHKYNCKPLPTLLSANEANGIIAELKKNAEIKTKFRVPNIPFPTQGDQIIVTHVASQRILYVRPVRDDYEELLSKVEENSKKAPNLVDQPEIDDIVLVPYKSTFHRGRVIDKFDDDVDGNNVLVFFIDVGRSANYPWTCLKKLNYKTRGYPSQTFKVILKGVDLASTEAKTFLEKLCASEEWLEIVEETNAGSDKYVSLKAKQSQLTINEIIQGLASQRIARVSDSTDNTNRLLFDKSKIENLPEGENIKIRLLDLSELHKGVAVCMLAENYLKLWKIERDVNNFGNSQAATVAYKPRKDELCMVKIGKSWNRGLVENVKENSVDVLLIDKMIMKNVRIDEARQLPDQFSVNFFSHICSVKAINEVLAVHEHLKTQNIVSVDEVVFDTETKRYSLVFKQLNTC